MIARLPDDEAARLVALHEHRVLDTAPEEEFDDLVRLAAHVCGTPIAAVSLVDAERQWFKASLGLDVMETSREVSFCAHTILQPGLTVVPDAQDDPRFADNPQVTGDPRIRFYAGAPLVTERGQALGSLCVIDRVPRHLTPKQEGALRMLARQASLLLAAARRLAERERLVAEKERLVLEKERAAAERERAEAVLEKEREFTRALLESLQEGIVACDAAGRHTLINRAAREFHGLPAGAPPADLRAAPVSHYAADGLTPLRAGDGPLVRALAGEVVRGAEMVIVPGDGPARTVLAGGQALYGPGGEKLGAVVALHDVTERRQAERETARLAAIVASSEEAVLGVTLDGTVVSWNGGAERLYGYTAAEMVGRHVSCLVAAGEHSPFPEIVARLRRGDAAEPMEVLRVRADGAEFHAAVSFSPIRDASGGVVGVSCIARDITVRKRAEAALARTHAALAESEAALRAVLESAPLILYAADAAGTVTLSEGRGLAALGLRPGEAVGRSVFEFGGGSAEVERSNRRALAGEAVSYDARVYGLCLHTELRPVRAGDGSPAGIVGVCMDVTARMRAEEKIRDHAVVLEFQEAQRDELERANAQLEALATTDGLTGLKNHRAFQERLAEEVVRAGRYGTPLSVILLDVDRFKQYNDSHGHPAGDAVLRAVARALQDAARGVDVVARYGGEEFVLVLPQTDLAGAAALAERLRAALERRPWPVRAVTASFGVACLRMGGEGGADLIARADAALYRSKEAGRNCVTCAPALIAPAPDCPGARP